MCPHSAIRGRRIALFIYTLVVHPKLTCATFVSFCPSVGSQKSDFTYIHDARSNLR